MRTQQEAWQQVVAKEQRFLQEHPPWGSLGESELTKEAYKLVDQIRAHERSRRPPNAPDDNALLEYVRQLLAPGSKASLEERHRLMDQLENALEIVQLGEPFDIHAIDGIVGRHTDLDTALTGDGCSRAMQGNFES